jgi:acetyl esterase/lipase
LPDILIYAAIIVFVLWVAHRFLRSRKHPHFDLPHVTLGRTDGEPSRGHKRVLELLAQMQAQVQSVPRRRQLAELRRVMDEGAAGWPTSSILLGTRFHPVDIDGMAAEWVLAPLASADRRMLYLHGGAFITGSPRSHRMLTAELSRRCGVSVLAIDYRLMPENSRLDSVIDTQDGLQWMLDNGPGGPAPAREIYIAGDSAGGNLALMVSAWARDKGLDPINGVIAFSPSTDSTLTGHSMTENIRTDPMLGPSLGFFARMPVKLKEVLAMAGSRTSPRNPLVSPLFGNLANLPPTLVQASESEMLLDDARRYVAKARRQGSPVTLQTWPGMVHVWPMFHGILPEGRQALTQVAQFVGRISAGWPPSGEDSTEAA